MKNILLGLFVTLICAFARTSDVESNVINVPFVTETGDEVYLMKYLGFMAQAIDHEVNGLIEQLRANHEMQPNLEYSESCSSWLVMLKHKDGVDSFAGIVQAELNDDLDRGYFLKKYAAISFFIVPAYRRKNLAYQATFALIKHLLRDEQKPRVFGIVFDVANENDKAKSLMQKLVTQHGFTKSVGEREISLGSVSLKSINAEPLIGHRWFRYYRDPTGKLLTQDS